MSFVSYTQLKITNLALRLLGDDPVTTTSESTRRAQLALEFFESIRLKTLTSHPWREALKLATINAYTEPAGTLTIGSGYDTVGTTGVTFDVATVTPFTSAMASTPEYRIWEDGGSGKATITGFTDTNTVTATIVAAFSTNSFASGLWRLYTGEPDAFGIDWSFIIDAPSDCAKVWKINEASGARYAKMGPAVYYTNVESLEIEYIQDLAVTSWREELAMAMAYHLAYTISEPLQKSKDKTKEMWEKYQACLAEARTATDQEATPEEAESNQLVDIRYGGVGPTSSWTRRFGGV